jgi:hypothetical protein
VFNDSELLDTPIFPKMQPDGKIQAGVRNNGEGFFKLFKQVLKDAGIDKANHRRTMHTFRRGGLQYRFIHAPKRWNIESCRRWGGWKSADLTVVMGYLLNETLEEEDTFYASLLDPDLKQSHIVPGDETELTIATVQSAISGLKEWMETSLESLIRKTFDKILDQNQHPGSRVY